MLSKPEFQRRFSAREGLARRLELSSELLDGRHNKQMKANFMSFSPLQVRQIIVIQPPVFLGTVRLIRGQGRLKVRLIRRQGRFSSELRFDQQYRKVLTAFLCVD